MYDYGARFYDPSIGVFNSVDPLTGKFPSQNGYIYAYNNPVRYIDVDGLYGDECDAENQRNHAVSQGLNVGAVYQSGDEWGFNIIDGENSSSTFDKDFTKNTSTVTKSVFSSSGREGNDLGEVGYSVRIAGGSAYNDSSKTAISIGAEASLANAKADLRIGPSLFGLHGEVEGSLLKGEANLDLGIFTGQKNSYGLIFDGNYGVMAAEGEFRGGGSILGVKWTYELGGTLGSAHIGGRAGAYFNDSTRIFTIDFDQNVGLLIGEKAGLRIDIPIPTIEFK